MSDARTEVLQRIKRATSDMESTTVARLYRHESGQGSPDLFAERLGEYKSCVHFVESSQIGLMIRDCLELRGAKNVVVSEDVPVEWMLDCSAAIVSDNPPLTRAQLNKIDAVVSACAVAIADTGTIVLSHGVGESRRALSLVPDYHLVVVLEEQIVPNVPAAVEKLSPTTPMTWISGSSATSDIELSRVEGVHGPRTLDVIVVTEKRSQ